MPVGEGDNENGQRNIDRARHLGTIISPTLGQGIAMGLVAERAGGWADSARLPGYRRQDLIQGNRSIPVFYGTKKGTKFLKCTLRR